jgi:predicted amidohydrolase YtcJ
MLTDLQADLILTGATVITVAPERPRAEAIAVRGDRILAVGTADEIGALRGPKTEVLDLHGKTVVPGFNDAHNHMLSFGMQLSTVSLRLPTVEAMVAALRERAAQQPPGTWVIGTGYDNNKLPGGLHPTRWDLDQVSTEHFVVARQNSGHMCVANSRALADARVGRDTADPEGGHIVRDEHGEPTGLLQEHAQGLLRQPGYPYPVDQLVAALRAAGDVYVREGITSHTEAGIGHFSPIELDVYAQARLPLRSTLMVHVSQLQAIGDFFGLQQGVRTGWGDDWLRIGPLKMFSDGSLIGRTAAMHDPYAPEPENAGFFATPPERLRQWCLDGHRSGWQLATHAIGDRAVDFMLDCYEEAMRLHPRPDPRHRIEHCGVVSPATLARIRRLGVIPVPQQHFIGAIGDGMARSLGPERARWCYPQKSYLAHGIPLPGSSDRPVVDGAPLLGIHDAVNQRTASGADYQPEERLTPEEAIAAYTTGSAYASGDDGRKGRIRAGMLADFAVLGADPTRVPPAEIAAIPVVATIAGGRVVFDGNV